MDVVGIGISKAKFDAALLVGKRSKHATFSNTEAGFEQFLTWLTKHRPDPAMSLHACMEATGSWGLELADTLHGRGLLGVSRSEIAWGQRRQPRSHQGVR